MIWGYPYFRKPPNDACIPRHEKIARAFFGSFEGPTTLGLEDLFPFEIVVGDHLKLSQCATKQWWEETTSLKSASFGSKILKIPWDKKDKKDKKGGKQHIWVTTSTPQKPRRSHFIPGELRNDSGESRALLRLWSSSCGVTLLFGDASGTVLAREVPADGTCRWVSIPAAPLANSLMFACRTPFCWQFSRHLPSIIGYIMVYPDDIGLRPMVSFRAQSFVRNTGCSASPQVFPFFLVKSTTSVGWKPEAMFPKLLMNLMGRIKKLRKKRMCDAHIFSPFRVSLAAASSVVSYLWSPWYLHWKSHLNPHLEWLDLHSYLRIVKAFLDVTVSRYFWITIHCQ